MFIVNSIQDVRHEVAALLQDPSFAPICWVGLFGSISRSTHSPTSDVDLILGYENTTKVYSLIGAVSTAAEKRFGRPVELLHLFNRQVTAYLTMEALLTSVTVYGPDEWPAKLRETSRAYLNDGYHRFKQAYSLLREIQTCVNATHVEVEILHIPL
jgi:predicted nucleotidyltransferase